MSLLDSLVVVEATGVTALPGHGNVATVTVPEGYLLLSGGWSAGNSNGELDGLVIVENRPVDDSPVTQWTVLFSNNTASTVTLHAYALCLNLNA